MPGIIQSKPIQSNKIIWYFLLAWTVLNVIQASTLELQGDEAYYWMYSRYLDWGYFDHPPMVALFNRIGDSIMHNELGLRLLTVLASSASIYLLWLILKKYAVDAMAFVLIVPGLFIFHIYGFTTTPDAPLFFFTVLFYFLYQQYIEKDKWVLAVLLGITVACLLYSKYNGILVVGFTLLANLKLLKRGSFWAIVLIAVGLYIPHIIWQANHDYPSINYHLFERSADTYSVINSFSYIPGQLLMAGPLIGWFLFYKAFTVKVKDAFIRCLLVNCIGTFIFFWLSSAKGEVQPQWAFILFAPLIVLTLIHFKQQGGWPKWLLPLAIVNVSIIIIVRVIVIGGFGFAQTYGHLKSYYGFKDWTHTVQQKASGHYVVMSDGFQNPSKYNYYTNSLTCFAYDTRYYRLTQFDIWPMEDSIQRKRVYYLTTYPIKGVTTDSIKMLAGTWYCNWVDDVRTYQKLVFETDSLKITTTPGVVTNFDLKLTNPYKHPITFRDSGYLHPVKLEYCFFKGDVLTEVKEATDTYKKITLQPGESTHYTFPVTSPKEKGIYNLVFSLRTDPFYGSKNSRVIKITVK
ncbi:glycosyltransferase family 39 protein [Mucilaginibacter sp. BJC16-A38]|uniref:ArnT family glycosyltransferase n=1 Tax=Mucilaginibacter phenanthrenivorans TaxID=1234842 RepID=UPI002158589E|nr:glycosyltransferase family 39 protein [Mucilaginibacter phenanthrenivorans]MCR8557924.1 glycosyltransferase family 39 protein [Mucilaginibacter phenanthrenivorans]